VTYDESKDAKARLVLINSTILIFGYPSRDGITVFDSASPTNFDFLGLDKLDPPMRRHQICEEGDGFRQKLLLLGI
jgi:hypothetical protein